MVRRFLSCLFISTCCAAQTIEGTVADAVTHSPLPGVKVSIEGDGKAVAAANTDAQGAFRIEGLAPGRYGATFTRKGYEGPAAGSDARKPFLLTSGSPIHFDVSMRPMGKVSGRVLDSSGASVPGAIVQLMGGRTGYDEVADRDGRFTFEQAPAGSYRLWAEAPKSVKPPPPNGDVPSAWVPTFYPGVREANAAGRLVVLAGSELSGLDIRLQALPVHRLRGVVIDMSDAPVARVRVTLSSNQGILLKAEDRETHTVTDDEGAFEFPDVTDGVWRLSAEVERGEKLRAFRAETVAGHDLDRLKLRLSPPFTVSGVVVREVPAGAAAQKPPAMLVLVVPEGGGTEFHQAAPDDQGRFHLDGIHPGRYMVRPIQPGPPYYLASITQGGREVPFLQPVELLSAGQPLTIVYKSNGGGVRGTVEDCGAATVMFYPQDPALQIPELIQRAVCGDRGHFEIANMRPGEYYGFAFDRAPGLEEMFFGFELDQGLVNQAIRVTVRAGEFTVGDLRVTRRQ